MVSNTRKSQSILIETKLMRRQADDLLHRLIDNRVTIEKKVSEAGRKDPMKFITGHSAIDDAIDSTRQLITHMDELLQEAAGHFESESSSSNGHLLSVASVYLK